MAMSIDGIWPLTWWTIRVSECEPRFRSSRPHCHDPTCSCPDSAPVELIAGRYERGADVVRDGGYPGGGEAAGGARLVNGALQNLAAWRTCARRYAIGKR